MAQEIKITKKALRRWNDGYKVVSVRMKEEMLERRSYWSLLISPFLSFSAWAIKIIRTAGTISSKQNCLRYKSLQQVGISFQEL